MQQAHATLTLIREIDADAQYRAFVFLTVDCKRRRGDFVVSLRDHVASGKLLSARQLDCVERMISERDERKAEKAKRDAEWEHAHAVSIMQNAMTYAVRAALEESRAVSAKMRDYAELRTNAERDAEIQRQRSLYAAAEARHPRTLDYMSDCARESANMENAQRAIKALTLLNAGEVDASAILVSALEDASTVERSAIEHALTCSTIREEYADVESALAEIASDAVTLAEYDLALDDSESAADVVTPDTRSEREIEAEAKIRELFELDYAASARIRSIAAQTLLDERRTADDKAAARVVMTTWDTLEAERLEAARCERAAAASYEDFKADERERQVSENETRRLRNIEALEAFDVESWGQFARTATIAQIEHAIRTLEAQSVDTRVKRSARDFRSLVSLLESLRVLLADRQRDAAVQAAERAEDIRVAEYKLRRDKLSAA